MDIKFDGTDDFFDSRDVLARIEELLSDALLLGPEEREEYRALVALRDEAETQIPDWQYGETFYEREYFRENYAEEFVKDTGYLSPELPSWITNNIDWEGVADALLEDYTEFEFAGKTYVAR